MHAEIVSIGDEITSGRLLDTNSQWLSRKLAELGVPVLYHTSVGDSLDACANVFRQALDRADLVIATGGLGPTADDLTREAIAAATGRKLVLDQDALAHVRAMFARRNRPMPASNEKQALFPEGSRVIRNPNGTAPGIDLTVARRGRGESRVLALPGVPPEVEEMWRDSVGDAVVCFAGRLRTIRHRAIKCFGVGESQVETMLPDLIRRGRQPLVGINASQATIILRITAEGDTAEEADLSMIPTVETINACLGNLVFGEGDDELQDAVLRLLDMRNATLATVEQATEGLVAEWLDHASRHTNAYLGGLVVRSEESAARVLGIPNEMLDRHAAGSDEVEVMACQCRDRFGADYALAVGRFPPLAPSVPEPAVVYFALAGPGGVVTRRHPYASHPAILTATCAKNALNFVRLALLEAVQA